MARLVSKIYPNDVDENNPIGVGFPLTIGTQNQNFFTSQQVHDNLRNLILTMKGERPMNPTFGCDIYYLLFEQLNDDTIQEAAFDAVTSAVSEWMPAVNIRDLELNSRYDENLVIVKIFYSVNGWSADNVLNLEVKV